VQNPLNKGVFVLGGGRRNRIFTRRLRQREGLRRRLVQHQSEGGTVEGTPPVRIAPLSSTDRRRMLSNSIVDTGTNALFLAPDVLNAIGDG